MIIALQTLVFFRQSLLTIFERLLSPYYRKLSLVFIGREDEEAEDEEDQVFADFDDEKGVVFFPPMYSQRYAAVSDCLMDERWAGKLEKVVDLGYHDMSFIKYLKDMPGVRCILGVDIESIPLRCSSELLGCDEYAPKRESPLHVALFQGNAADPDYRLIGCDAVISIEMIEHMLPHDLERLVHNVFGFIRPWIAIFTTPNADFNVLFKNMEKNGLRRWDHLFEWTREQFHDWCSNIVSRYPVYTVHCKGIGPGPPGTQHLGCCSQMALFVNTDYHKQRDLDLNSLALVAKMPSPCNVQDMIGWESPRKYSETEAGQIYNAESQNEILFSGQSCVTILLSQYSSIETLEYRDSTSQCNLDCEFGRNYLMFDNEETSHVVVPRRTLNERVYIMEDVYSRLNCSTFQVKKFSKTTQNLMAKNKGDSLVHIREVVDEIRHLTRMLNFNKNSLTDRDESHTWNNINWGDNAPYWNQYYIVVREYNHPFEMKSDECRILDLISAEMNRLIDNQYDEEYSADVNKLEIPIAHLMRVVRHITTDVEKVKDLLEWNGYEVVNDTVVHSRLVIDTPSMGSRDDEWIENDFSDWDNDVRSTSFSDGSNVVLDYHGRCLRRALDKKVRKLRSMMCADEDITTELDRVVCRLMKLALWSSKGKQQPPPTRWMQCKLLDLLTLTEKAIARRKKYYVEECVPMKAIAFGSDDLARFKHEVSARHIEAKYKEFCSSPDRYSRDVVDELRDKILASSNRDDLLIGYNINRRHEAIDGMENLHGVSNDLHRHYNWLQKQNELEQKISPTHRNINKINSAGLRVHLNNDVKTLKKYKKPNGNSKHDNHDRDSDAKSNKSVTKVIEERRNIMKFQEHVKTKYKVHKTCSGNKIELKKTSSRSSGKFRIKKNEAATNDKINMKRKNKMQPSASKPIPASIIELCHPDLAIRNTAEQEHVFDLAQQTIQPETNIAATKESLLIDIVMDDMEETIALRRTIGTDADEEQAVLEQETLLGSIANTHDNAFPLNTGNQQSETIFLYDLNEPSTSKGVRHTSLDVQCGPDACTPGYVMLSPASSGTKMSTALETGIKIGDSSDSYPTDLSAASKNFGSSTNIENFHPVCHRTKSPCFFQKGIKIGDSDTDITRNLEDNDCDYNTTAIIEEYEHGTVYIVPKFRKTGTNQKKSLFKDNVDKGNKIDTTHDKTEQECIKFTASDASNDEKQKQSNNLGFSVFTEDEKTTCVQTHKQSDVHNNSMCQLNEIEGSDGSSCQIFRLNRSPARSPKKLEVSMSSDNKIAINEESKSKGHAFAEDTPRSPSPCCRTLNNIVETQLRNHISSAIDVGDSISDFCGSFDSPQSPVNYCVYKHVTNTSERFSVDNVNKDVSKKYVRPKLSCGGIHTHSYRDNQVFEDVMFQGRWQKNNFNTPVRRKSSCPVKASDVSYKTKIKKTNIKEELVKPQPKEVKVESRKKLLIRNLRLKKSTQGLPKSQTEPTITTNVVKRHNTYTPCVRVSSKTALSLNKMRKNPKKQTPTPKKFWVPAGKSPSKVTIAAKKSSEKVKTRLTRKSYIPAYLKRLKNIKNNNLMNDSFGSTATIIKRSKSSLVEEPTKYDVESSHEFVADVQDFVPDVNTIVGGKPLENTQATPKTDYVKKIFNISDEFESVKKGVTKFSTPTVIRTNKYKSKHALKQNHKNELDLLVRKDVKKDLIKFSEPRDISYYVFRNELEKNVKSSTNCNSENPRENARTKSNNNNRKPSSPVSQHSSCSSPDSVATVKIVLSRPAARYSTSSNKSSIANSESEPTTPARIRRYTKRIKNKKNDDKDKENVPETSKTLAGTEATKSDKSAFTGRKKNVYMAMATETPTLNNKSNFKIPVIKSNDDKKQSKSAVLPAVSTRKSVKSNDSSCNGEVQTQDSASSEISNMVLLIDSRHREQYICNETAVQSTESVKQPSNNEEHIVSSTVDRNNSKHIVDELLLESNKSEHTVDEFSVDSNYSEHIVDELLVDSNNSDYIVDELLADGINSATDSSTISSAMRHLIEDRLVFINSSCEIKLENAQASLYDATTPTIPKDSLVCDGNENWSYTSVMAQESFWKWHNENRVAAELDMLSFKSVTSGSKYSDYFLAENEFENTLVSEPPVAAVTSAEPYAPRSNSVRDIFERKEPLISPNPASGLAVQAFSGFSMNAEPVSGDQPDYVNLVDSETGSLAVDYHTRQAASEELFVSGRSSESYESCLLEEDAVVPNWLFEIIQQQQQQLAAAESLEQPRQFIGPIPIAEPDLDMNNNLMEPAVGVAAGAGDGHGIHSDHSQDSSGHGSSLSSTDTSSGQTSEGLPIEPSGYARLELQDGIGSSANMSSHVPGEEVAVVTFRSVNGVTNASELVSSSRAEHRCRHPLLLSSDADVSSLDTDDVPDSS